MSDGGAGDGRRCRLQVVGERRGQVRTQRVHRRDAGLPEEAEVRREEELQRLFGARYSGKWKIGNINEQRGSTPAGGNLEQDEASTFYTITSLNASQSLRWWC